MPSPFSEAVSTLNDRALRRLLGARAFLRGYDYVRRHAVDGLTVEDASAKGSVRGTEPVPYDVSLQLTPTGFSSTCTCPAFSKIHGHCKHVAALLIAARDQARGTTGVRARDPHGAGGIAGIGGLDADGEGEDGEGDRDDDVERGGRGASYVARSAARPAYTTGGGASG